MYFIILQLLYYWQKTFTLKTISYLKCSEMFMYLYYVYVFISSYFLVQLERSSKN